MGVKALADRCGNYNGTEVYRRDEENMPLAILMAGVFFLALTSNFLLMCVILRNPKLRTVPNKLVFNLSLCGLFTVVFNGPFVVSSLMKGRWIYGCLMCDLNGFTTTVYGFSAMTTLAIISVNRYQLVKMPSERQKSWITPERLPYVTSSVWLFSCLLAVPPLIGWSNYDYIPERAICTLKWSTDLYYTSFIFLLGALLPFIVIMVSYFKIFLTVRNSFRNLNSHQIRRVNIRQENTFPEAISNELQPDMTDSKSSHDPDKNLEPSMTKTNWMERKNRVRPNNHSVSSYSKKRGIELCALSKNSAMYFSNGHHDKNREGDKNINRTRFVSKTNCEHLTEKFIKENNKLLLLQLESSMGVQIKRLEPITVNESKSGRGQHTKKMKTAYTKSGRKIGARKRKVQERKLPVKTRRSNINAPNKQMTNNCKPWQLDKTLHNMPFDTNTDHIGNQKCKVSSKEQLPCVRNSKTAENYGNEYSSKDTVYSSNQSSTKSSENSQSKLLHVQPKHQNLNEDVRVFTGEILLSSLPTFTSKKLFSNSVSRSAQRTYGSTSMRDELRITAMLFVILASFIMCWAPIAIVNLIETISSNPLSQRVNEFSVFMMFFSSVVNPLTYGLLNRNFRKELSDLCRFKCKHGNSSTTNTEGRTHGVKNIFTVVE